MPPVKFGFDLLNSLVFFPRPPTSSRKDSGNLVWNHLKFSTLPSRSFLPGTGWKWAKLPVLQHCPIAKDACSECAPLQETGCPPVVLSVPLQPALSSCHGSSHFHADRYISLRYSWLEGTGGPISESFVPMFLPGSDTAAYLLSQHRSKEFTIIETSRHDDCFCFLNLQFWTSCLPKRALTNRGFRYFSHLNFFLESHDFSTSAALKNHLTSTGLRFCV